MSGPLAAAARPPTGAGINTEGHDAEWPQALPLVPLAIILILIINYR